MPHHPWSVLLTALLWGMVPEASAADAAPVTEHLVAFLGPADSPTLDGVRLGVDEANVQGRFLGHRFALVVAAPDAPPPPTATALHADLPLEALEALARAHPTVPVFNLALDADEARAVCLPNLFHVPPSRAMKAAAEAQWQQANPERKATAVAWNAGFERYAAKQLNIRFVKKAGRPMDPPAWAGWAASRLHADTAMRLSGGPPEAVLAHLHDGLAFDGQKGIAMTFRSSGQLRQMLLLEADGEVVGEAPVRGVADVEDLDSLGGGDCPSQAP